MTREELLALPRADQSRQLMEWDKILIVTTDDLYEDSTTLRMFAVVGMTARHGVLQATHLITEGDILTFDNQGIAPNIDVIASHDNCVGIFNFTYKVQVYGGGGTVFMKFITPSNYHKL